MNEQFQFAHRKNADASIDSICTICFQTIANENDALELTAHEERHVCDLNWRYSRVLVGLRERTPARRSYGDLGEL